MNVYSCTKALANACIMRLVSTGHLHYDDRVAKVENSVMCLAARPDGGAVLGRICTKWKG